jgi:predicted nucleic-acid-binding protein
VIALDTNVVVRLLVDDEPAQTKRVRDLMAAHTALVLPTVLLETEWVLRSAYHREPHLIAELLRNLLGLPNVVAPNAGAVAQAIS